MEGWRCEDYWSWCWNEWDAALAGWNVDRDSVPWAESCGEDFVPFGMEVGSDSWMWEGATGVASLGAATFMALAVSLAF